MADREFSAGGIVIKKVKESIKVLLIKDTYGHWTWPKGNIERGEPAVEAAIREIKEETGLDAIGAVEKIGKSTYFYRLRGRLIFKTVYIFLFRLLKEQGLKIQTEEIEQGCWFSTGEALKMVDYKGAKETLKKAIRSFKTLEK